MKKLKVLDVFYGNKCNLACHQCDTRSDIFRTEEGDPNLENIIESITLSKKHFNIEMYSILGGEPLLYLEKITEIVKFIRSIDNVARIILPTNGLLIDKKIETVVQLVKDFNITVVISDHCVNFDDKTFSNKVVNNTKILADRLEMNPSEYYVAWNDFLNFDNKKQDNYWQSWIDHRTDRVTGTSNLAFSNSKNYLFLTEQADFQSHYKIVNGKPKPFSQGDPEASYRNGCADPFCSFLFDKKLYKCGALGTLKRFLEYHGSLDDKEWDQYLKYKPLDLTNCTIEEVSMFSDTRFSPIKECQMCPNSADYKSLKTPDKVIPIKVSK